MLRKVSYLASGIVANHGCFSEGVGEWQVYIQQHIFVQVQSKPKP
jgi:hypothetical protein